jgi:hypothetical protein
MMLQAIVGAMLDKSLLPPLPTFTTHITYLGHPLTCHRIPPPRDYFFVSGAGATFQCRLRSRLSV